MHLHKAKGGLVIECKCNENVCKTSWHLVISSFLPENRKNFNIKAMNTDFYAGIFFWFFSLFFGITNFLAGIFFKSFFPCLGYQNYSFDKRGYLGPAHGASARG